MDELKEVVYLSREKYARTMIEQFGTFFVPTLQNFDGYDIIIYFQQIDATAYMTKMSMNKVLSSFPEKVTSRFGDIPWLQDHQIELLVTFSPKKKS